MKLNVLFTMSFLAKPLLAMEVNMGDTTNLLFPGQGLFANDCYQSIMGATLTDFAVALCSIGAGSTLAIPDAVCTSLAQLVSETRVYRFCPFRTYETGRVFPDSTNPLGFSTSAGNDYQFIVLLPNVKIECVQCTFVAAEPDPAPGSSVISGPVLVPDSSQVPLPGFVVDASNLIVEGVTFTQQEGAALYGGMITLDSKAENVMIKSCSFEGIANSETAVRFLYRGDEDTDDMKPYSTVTVEFCTFEDNSVTNSVVYMGKCGCSGGPPSNRPSSPGSITVVGSTFISNTYNGVALMEAEDWPVAFVNTNKFCDNSGPGPLVKADVAGSIVVDVVSDSACEETEDCGFLFLICIFQFLWELIKAPLVFFGIL